MFTKGLKKLLVKVREAALRQRGLTESGKVPQECQLTMVTNLEAGRSPQIPHVSAGVFKSDVSYKLEGLIFPF